MRKIVFFGIWVIIVSLLAPSSFAQRIGKSEIILKKLRELGWRMIYYKSRDREIWGNGGYIYRSKTPEYPKKKKTIEKVIPLSIPQPKMLSEKELEELRSKIQNTLNEFALERGKRVELEKYLSDIEEQIKSYKEEVKIEKEEKYTVVKGDSLWKISKKFYSTPLKWPIIYKANQDKIKDPNRIYPGQVLLIPTKVAKKEKALPKEHYLK